MSAVPEGKPFRFVPKTTVGKALLGLYLLAFVAIALSVTGVVFSDARMFGPLPEVAIWTYFWYGVINVVLLGTYFYLFKPWADTAAEFVDADSEAWDDAEARESSTDDGSELIAETRSDN